MSLASQDPQLVATVIQMMSPPYPQGIPTSPWKQLPSAQQDQAHAIWVALRADGHPAAVAYHAEMRRRLSQEPAAHQSDSDSDSDDDSDDEEDWELTEEELKAVVQSLAHH